MYQHRADSFVGVGNVRRKVAATTTLAVERVVSGPGFVGHHRDISEAAQCGDPRVPSPCLHLEGLVRIGIVCMRETNQSSLIRSCFAF